MPFLLIHGFAYMLHTQIFAPFLLIHEFAYVLHICVCMLFTYLYIATSTDVFLPCQKNSNIDTTLEDGSDNSNNAPCQHFGVSSAAHSTGSFGGSSSSAYCIDEAEGFPSSSLSLSMPNFSEHLGSHAISKALQATSTSCIMNSMVNPSAIQKNFFLPAAAGVYLL